MMNYPLISEYVEAIKMAEENFEELSYLRPVLDDTGQPVMSSGNFAVVFKMKDERDGKLYAVRCFHRDQEGREESYRLIEEELKDVESPYLVSFRYIDKELFVDSSQTDETEFPVLLMDWVEGLTLDKYIREHIDNQYELSLLAYQFSCLAMWLMLQPFAHGDLKPDNIIVKDDGRLVLVDYDGMYVPAMKGQKARELGSPDFRHPHKTETDFDEHIDDFSLVSILLSLKAISLQPELLEEYGTQDRLLLSEIDYRDANQCKFLHVFFPADDIDLNKIYSLFCFCLYEGNLPIAMSQALNIKRPKYKTRYDITYLKKRAYHGDVNSQYKLGVCYIEGDSIEKNYDEAIKWLNTAACANHGKALRTLGDCYIHGIGVNKDAEKALCLLQQAEMYYDKEDVCAIIEYKIIALKELKRYNEVIGLLKEYVQPGKGCRKCSLTKIYNQSERSCSWMQIELGLCYDNGIGVEKDFGKAVEWFTKAAKQGDSAGQRLLGLCYYNGTGVEKDFGKAVEWFTKAAKQGNSAGQRLLGLCYYNGTGVEKDFGKAVEWFTKAAKQGNSSAQYNLGQCYALGHGVAQCYEKAVEWFVKAAEQKNTNALLALGTCYKEGKGVSADFMKALEYINKARDLGNDKIKKLALQQRTDILAKMSDDNN